MRVRKQKSEATRARDTVVEPHTLLIAVTDPRVHDSDVLYKVAIMDPARPRTAIHTVDRTFSQLKPIIAKLKLIAPDAGLPEVTKSKMFGSLQPAYMEERRGSMEMFLNAICDHRMLCYEAEFLDFVGFSEAAKDRMARSALLLQLTSTPTLSVFVQLLQQRGSIVDQEENIQSAAAAARNWLRGRQDYSFIRVLGKITHPKWVHKKINILVEDSSRRQHVLTIQPIVSDRGFLRPISYKGSSGDDSPLDRLKKVRHMIAHLAKRGGSIFALPSVIEVMEDWVVSVRPFYPAGSLYDLLHDVRDPLSRGSLKYAQPVGGLPADILQQVAQGVLQMVRACHEYNMPLPTLTMGNVMVDVDRATRKVSVLLAGIEDIVSGNGWLPLVPPLDGIDTIRSLLEDSPVEDAIPKTNIDLLLFGAILYQCATGIVLDTPLLAELLSVQGDPYVPPVALPASAVSNVNHIFGGEGSRMPLPRTILPEVLNLLHYLFHPTIPADIRILVHHAFLRMPSRGDDGPYSSPSGDGALPLREKDVGIIESISSQWVGLWEKNRAKKDKLEQQKVEIKLGVATTLSVGEGIKRKQTKRSHERRREEELAALQRPVTPPPPPPPAKLIPASAPTAPNMPAMTAQSGLQSPPALTMERAAPLPETGAPAPPPPKRPPPPPSSGVPPPPPPKVAPPPPKKAPPSVAPPPPKKAPPSVAPPPPKKASPH